MMPTTEILHLRNAFFLLIFKNFSNYVINALHISFFSFDYSKEIRAVLQMHILPLCARSLQAAVWEERSQRCEGEIRSEIQKETEK
jgi:hypothetical protein